MSSFAEAAKARSAWKVRVDCKAGQFIRNLPDSEAAEIEEALADPTIGSTAILKELQHRYPDRDVPGYSSLIRHRRRFQGGERCQCA